MWRSATPEQTEAVGARLAATQPAASDAPLVVYLTGELGAGKTTLVRGFLRECGIRGVVRSPTYTLVETYDVGGTTIVHIDLYRLRDSRELEHLGVRDLARPSHVWLIEWPERANDRLPPPDLVLSLSVGSADHYILASARSARGRAWLESVDLES